MGILLGKKKEMTQIYSEKGDVLPCTIVDVSNVYFVGSRTEEKDGYEAIILGIGKKKRPGKAESSKYKELKFVPLKTFEFRKKLFDHDIEFKVGDPVPLDSFKIGDKVNLTGYTKGKGFQGVVKRWNFKGGPKTHGQSDKHRSPGSIGGGTDPGRVYKGKKMPGHMGNRKRTILNLEVVLVDSDNQALCIKGAVPGARGSLLKIWKS